MKIDLLQKSVSVRRYSMMCKILKLSHNLIFPRFLETNICLELGVPAQFQLHFWGKPGFIFLKTRNNQAPSSNCFAHYIAYDLTENNILIDEQRGFRKMMGSEELIQGLLKKWRERKRRGTTTVAVFLNLKRVFETINRKILVRKLMKIGIRGKAIKWIENYLSDRRQQVKWGQRLSDEMCVALGVPQGSRLGPLLYINDLTEAVKESCATLFADDTLVFNSEGEEMAGIEKKSIGIWVDQESG